MKEQLKKIDNKYIRLAVFIIVAINSSAMIMDVQILPFSNEEIVQGLSVVALVGSELWNHWKNNSYTMPAKEADAYIKSRKKELK